MTDLTFLVIDRVWHLSVLICLSEDKTQQKISLTTLGHFTLIYTLSFLCSLLHFSSSDSFLHFSQIFQYFLLIFFIGLLAFLSFCHFYNLSSFYPLISLSLPQHLFSLSLLFLLLAFVFFLSFCHFYKLLLLFNFSIISITSLLHSFFSYSIHSTNPLSSCLLAF